MEEGVVALQLNVAAIERSVEEIRNLLHSRQLNGKHNLITGTYSQTVF